MILADLSFLNQTPALAEPVYIPVARAILRPNYPLHTITLRFKKALRLTSGDFG